MDSTDGSSSAEQVSGAVILPWAWRIEARYRWLRGRLLRLWRATPVRWQVGLWLGLLLVVAFFTLAPVIPAGMRLNPAGEDRLLARIGRTYGFRRAYAYFSPRFFERECQRGIPRSEWTVYYRPLMFVSYAFDAALWDCDVRIGRSVNLLLHVANAFLLGLILLVLTQGSRQAAASASFLYLATPASAEPISWWAARSDLLSTTFSLAGLLALIVWTQRGGARYVGAAIFSFVCAVLSKESAGAVLPLACFWLLLAPKNEKSPLPQRALLLAGLLVLALAYLAFRVETHTLLRPPAARVGTHFALGHFLRFVCMPLAGVVMGLELKTMVPVNVGSLGLLAAAIIVLWPCLRQAALLAAWKVVFFLPAMSYSIIVPRYEYAPLAGAAALIALLCLQADRRWRPLWAPLTLVPWVVAGVLFGKDLFSLHGQAIAWTHQLSKVVHP